MSVHGAPLTAAESDNLAFCFTKAFDEERWAIHWYAPVRRNESKRRRDLLPEEPEHPRVDQAYYVLQLGPLERLEPPIISLRWRRITFIEVTWDRFQVAQEINELYASGADGLFVTLKELELAPERDFAISEDGVEYVADLVIPCRDGPPAIALDDRPAPVVALRFGSADLPNDSLDIMIEAMGKLGGMRSRVISD